MESCQKHLQARRKRQSYILLTLGRMGTAGCIKKRAWEREFVVDSGAGMHKVRKKDLKSTELETMRMSRNLTTVMTANGEVQTREETKENVKELDLFVTVMLLEETPAVLLLVKLCEDHGNTYHWTSSQKPHLTQNGKKINCNMSNYVPFVVPGMSTTSSTSSSLTSSTSSSKDSVIGRKKWEYGCRVLGKPVQEPAETENTIFFFFKKKRRHEELQSGTLHDLPDSLQEFRKNLVDESVATESRRNPSHGHRDTSSLLMNYQWSREPKWDQARVSTDLATQWSQSYQCKTKTSQVTQRSLQKFLEPDKKPKVIYTDNSLEFGKACEDLSWNHCTSTPHRSETNGIVERAVRRVKEGTSAVLLQSGLNESWWADSMECCCCLRNIPDLLSDGKHEKRYGIPFNGPVIPFRATVEYHLFLQKTFRDYIRHIDRRH